MKITFVRVGQYGGMRDRTFELQPGLNVFYGPNEAGKSTLRSFITATMFPKAPLKYPVQKGTDSGSLDVVLENGNHLTFERNGKKCSGTGSAICGIDDREYIAIYSMSPEDLRDVKMIEKGDIRNRFLTIPGGGDLPAAYESLDGERTALLPDIKRSSKCEIARLIEEEHDLRMKVKELQRRESGDSQYAALAARKAELISELEMAGARVTETDSVRAASLKATGRAEDLENIGKLSELEEKLSYSEGVDPVKLAELDAVVESSRKVLSETERELAEAEQAMESYDPETFLRNMKRIQSLEGLAVDYDFYKRQAETVTTAEPPAKKEGFPLIPVAGAVITVAGIAVAAIINPIGGAAVAVLGLVIAAVGFRKHREVKPVEPVPVQKQEDDRIRRIEEQLDEVANETGIERRGFHADVMLLLNILGKAKSYDHAKSKRSEAEKETVQAERELELFLSGYGGRDGFLKAVEDSKKLGEVRAQLSALRDSISDIDADTIDTETAEEEYREANETVRRLTAELAKTEQALKDISEDVSVDEAITASSDAGDAVYSACYRWARLMLEKLILDEASDNAYGSHRPDVLKKADRYLSAMTDGRYRLNTDPRLTEICVIENDTNALKTEKEWSSGLEDQIKLSMKMAVSLSLSQEKPPFILDDVLLTSDSGRKKAACMALSLLSKDIQVLYFTCDKETKDFLRMAGGKVHSV